MADVSQTQVEDALKTYIDPYLETDLVSAKAIKNIKIDKITVWDSGAGDGGKGRAQGR